MNLKQAFESEIARWDRRNKSHHSGAIALLRLDEVMAEIEAGKPVVQALDEGFNDRLLIGLLNTYAKWKILEGVA